MREGESICYEFQGQHQHLSIIVEYLSLLIVIDYQPVKLDVVGPHARQLEKDTNPQLFKRSLTIRVGSLEEKHRG